MPPTYWLMLLAPVPLMVVPFTNELVAEKL
jgi:hypothetical protein